MSEHNLLQTEQGKASKASQEEEEDDDDDDIGAFLNNQYSRENRYDG